MKGGEKYETKFNFNDKYCINCIDDFECCECLALADDRESN